MGPRDRHLDEEQLFELAEGGLDASARASAEAHIRGCAECRRELEIAVGYLKQISDLEPVKAPANFLANVRARLPRPSPLRACLDIFMRPLRVVPMQMALLTILGLTAISSYLYQRGGLDEPSQVAMSETSSSDRQEQEPSAAKSEEAYPENTQPPAPVAPPASPIVQAPGESQDGPVDKRSGQSSRFASSKARSKSASKPFEDAEGLAGGSDAAAKKDAPPRSEDAMPRVQEAPPLLAARKDGTLEDSPRQAPKAAVAPGPAPVPKAPASPPAAISRPAPLEEGFAASETLIAGQAPSASASGSARPSTPEPQWEPNSVADKTRRAESKEIESAPESKAAETREQDKSGKDPAALRKGKVAGTGAGAGAIGTAELPAFIVTLAPGKRIGDAVSGLKAMGADSLSAWAARDGGVPGKGMDYLFQVPASMRKDIAPYLGRYGRVEGAGLLPAAGTAPARIRIRFLP